MSERQPSQSHEQMIHQLEALTNFANNYQVMGNTLQAMLGYTDLRARHAGVQTQISQLEQAYREDPDEFDRLVESYKESEDVMNPTQSSESCDRNHSTGNRKYRSSRKKQYQETLGRLKDRSKELVSDIDNTLKFIKDYPQWAENAVKKNNELLTGSTNQSLTSPSESVKTDQLTQTAPTHCGSDQSEDGQSGVGADTLKHNLDIFTKSEGQGKSTEGSTPPSEK